MVPEPNDAPKPDDETDDEPDEEPDEEPDDETDDEPNEEPDDEPEPGTLYFGEDDGRMDGPILLKPNMTPQPPGGADSRTRRGRFLYCKSTPHDWPPPVQRCVAAPKMRL
jgi:hypothetical protein